MIKRLVWTAAALAAAGSAAAATTVGGATLIDTATVHAGTVTPVAYLSYVGGGNGLTGWASGSSWGATGESAATAMATADHHWLQFDAPIFMTSGAVALNAVIAIPALDHGWTEGNTGEFFEPFEFRIWGCTAPTATACVEQGHITDVWARGVDNSGPLKNADDFTTRWAFDRGSYNFFMIQSGDRLLGGSYSPGEGEIDALAVAVPEPESYVLMGLGLAVVGFVARRRQPAR